jgi:AcrR family transcriptional regulator
MKLRLLLIVQDSKRRAKQPVSANVDDGRLARGQTTRELILVTAERLFAEFGISAVSLRDIAAAAGQKNNAAVHYHFGDKEKLLKEIVLFRVKDIEEKSTAIQEKLNSGSKPPQVSDYVRSYVLPFEKNIDEGNYYLLFLSRIIIERGGISGLRDHVTIRSTDLLREGLRKALPNCPEPTIEARWQIVVISVIHSLASYQTAYRSGALTAPLEHLLDDLIRFHTAGLKAAPRPPSKRADAAPPPYPRRGVRTKPMDSER